MTAGWILFGAFCVAFAAFVAMTSYAIRVTAELHETEHRLRTSRQAHAMDVQSLTDKLLKARKEAQK